MVSGTFRLSPSSGFSYTNSERHFKDSIGGFEYFDFRGAIRAGRNDGS
jgi:hypothetical protein